MIIRRETNSGSNDLNVVYRPCSIDEMIGNTVNKRILKTALETNKVSHSQLFTGSAGCGKTTMARIMALSLNCEKNGISTVPCLECPTCKSILEGSSIDVKEINVGQSGGKAYVDSIIKDLPMAPFNSRFKVIIFDEAHELTQAAKELLLKPLENGYSHVYFIFCTNQPEKLGSKVKGSGEPFLDRFSIFNFKEINEDEMFSLLKNICEFEGLQYNTDVLDVIVKEANGIPRSSIMWLDKVIKEGSWHINVAKEICNTITEDENPNIMKLSIALNKGYFKEALDVYSKVKNVSIETIRIMVSGFFVGCLKRSKRIGDARKYSKVIDTISLPIYEQGKLAEHKWINYMFKITDIINTAGRHN